MTFSAEFFSVILRDAKKPDEYENAKTAVLKSSCFYGMLLC